MLHRLSPIKTWHQGFLGDWQEAKLPGAFGVQGIPSMMLIGPDGKVIAMDLRGWGRSASLIPAVPAA